jgi:hypothetical protein
MIMTAGTITDVIVYTGTMTMMPISHFCSCKTTGSGISGFAPKTLLTGFEESYPIKD